MSFIPTTPIPSKRYIYIHSYLLNSRQNSLVPTFSYEFSAPTDKQSKRNYLVKDFESIESGDQASFSLPWGIQTIKSFIGAPRPWR